MRTYVLFALIVVVGIACNASSPDSSSASGDDGGSPFDATAGSDASGGSDDAGASDAAPPVEASDDAPAACVDASAYPDAFAVNGDAGLPSASLGVACCTAPGEGPDGEVPATGPLAFSVTHGLSPSPDGGGSTAVPVADGYKVTLAPAWSTLPPGAALSNATFSIAELTSGLAYPTYSTGPVISANGLGFQAITLSLPAGVLAITYALSGTFALDASSSSSSFTSRGFQLLTVCGDGTVNAFLPDVPSLTLVHVTIDQLQNAPPPGGVVSLTLTTLDRTFSAQASATIAGDGGATSAVVSIVAPLGVPLVPELAGAGAAPTITLAGDTTISMPAQVQASGTITTSDAIDTSKSSVVCVVPEPAPSAAAAFPPPSRAFTGAITGSASPYSYSLLVPKGVSCALSATLALSAPAQTQGFLTSPGVTFDGTALVNDFTLPAVGSLVTFYASPAYVRGGLDATGREHFRAVSTSLTGGLGAWTYSTDFNHIHTGINWGSVVPGVYDLFLSE